MNIPLQAISFTNNIQGQHCLPYPTDWKYTVTPGDDICFQVNAQCEAVVDTLLNGSFETEAEGGGVEDWEIVVDNTEQTNLQRVTANAACGIATMKWTINATPPADTSLTQVITPAFEQGRTYRLTFKSMLEIMPSTAYNIQDGLRIIAGGLELFVTPTIGAYGDFDVLFTFIDAPTDNNLVFTLKGSLEGTASLYVDCVALGVMQECCVFNHINNGDFEDGQNINGDLSSILQADFWNNSSFSETEGIGGTRCMSLPGIGDSGNQTDILLPNQRYRVIFYARSEVDGTLLNFNLFDPSVTVQQVALTTEYQRFEIEFSSGTSNGIEFESATDEAIFIDDVSVYNGLGITYYIKDLNSDLIIPISPDDVKMVEGAENICFNADNYELPECFIICFTSCGLNLLENGNFEEGTGNDFTDWTEGQPTRTNQVLRSQEFDNAFWGKTGMASTTANATLAPDGTLTADLLTESNAAGSHYAASTTMTVTAGVKTMSLYVKPNGRRYILLYEGASDSGAYFDLQTGTVLGNQGTAPISKNIYPADNGFYRLVVTYTQVGTATSYQVYFSNNGTTPSYIGNGTSGIYYWGAQFEDGALVSPYIPTTSAAVTVNTGEILADSGGVGLTRAALLWFSGAGTGLSQTITLQGLTDYTIRIWAKNKDTALYQGGDARLKVILDGEVKYATVTDSYSLYQLNFTTSASPDDLLELFNEATNSYGFMEIDSVELYKTEEIPQFCSEGFSYTETPPECLKELVWYDRENAYGLNYESGFKNRLNLVISLQNPTYNRESLEKEVNGEETEVSAYSVWKAWDLYFPDCIPEYVWDAIAHMAGHSNIELDGQPLAINEDSTISIQWNENTNVWPGSVSLSPEGMYIIMRTKNCS